MHHRTNPDLQAAATPSAHELSTESELRVLRDVFRMLPHGVTLQDEQGRFLLVNDAAAAQLGVAAGEPQAQLSKELDHRRETCIEVLRAGRTAGAEECVVKGELRQVFLTSHRPVRIADRDLLLSSSADISELKALEDQLFRSAYYDELTDPPTRRVIEHRANKLLQRDAPLEKFALAFLDIDNINHIN